MDHVTATCKTRLYVKDWGAGAPHGLFPTPKRRLTRDLIDFLGR